MPPDNRNSILQPLGEVADVLGGGTPSRSRPELFGGSIPWITPTDLRNSILVPEVSASTETLTAEGLAESSAQRVPPGTVIYSSRATIGKVAIAGVSLATNQGFANFVPRPGIDSKYLAYALKWLTPQVKRIAGRTTFPEISKSEFKRLTIPVPSLEDQKRIVKQLEERLGKVDEAIRLQSTATREIQCFRGAVLTGVLDGTEQSVRRADVILSGDLPRPKALALTTLKEVMIEEPRNGWSPRCDNHPNGSRVLTLSAVTGYHYDGSQFKTTTLPTDPNAEYWLRPGDILVTRSNTHDLVGHAALYDGTPSPCIYPDLMIRIRVDGKRTDRRFVWYWLQSPLVRDYIKARAKGTSPSMKKISQQTVNEIPFPAELSLNTQQRIVERFDTLFDRLRRVEAGQTEAATQIQLLSLRFLNRTFDSQL